MKRSILFALLSILATTASASPYAIVAPGGQVLNIVRWDGVTPFTVSPNTLVDTQGSANAQIGGTYSAGTFTPPAQGTPAQGILFAAVPTSGGTTTCPPMGFPPGGVSGYRQLTCELVPAGAVSGQTVVLPTSPQDGDQFTLISVGFAITSCVISSPGVAQVNIPASFTLAAGVSQTIKYFAQLNAWVRY